MSDEIKVTPRGETGNFIEQERIGENAGTQPEASGEAVESGEGIIAERIGGTSSEAVPAEQSSEAEGSAQEKAEAEAQRRLEEERAQWDKKFTALAKKEKSIQSQLQELKKLQEGSKSSEELRELAKNNPAKLLEDMGIPLDNVIQSYLQSEGQAEEVKEETPDDKYKMLEEKLNKLEEEKKQEIERLEQQKIDQSVSKFKTEINDFVGSDERFETISALGEQDLVFQVIEQHYNANAEKIDEGLEELLSIEKAAALVEKELEERVNKVLNLKKYASKLQPAVEEAKIEDKEEVSSAKEKLAQKIVSTPATKTITNKVVSSTPVKRVYGWDQREESIERAAKVLQERLNSKR